MVNEIRVAPNDVRGPYEVEMTGPIKHRCPFVDELDEGTITITYLPGEKIIELHSLANYLAEWESNEVSHETITAAVAEDIAEALADHGRGMVRVVTEWETAGLNVAITVTKP